MPYNQVLDAEEKMLLIAAATENEIKPLAEHFDDARVEIFVMGMGPVTAAARLSNYLTLHGARIGGVLNIGVAGAYVGSGMGMLDICLAQKEFLGDFGICMHDEIQDFDHGLLKQGNSLLFENHLVSRVEEILNSHKITYNRANFVTVNCCSGTEERGEFLRKKFAAGCENMEGAAVAMVCKNFDIACVELRCISNMVENRDTTKWKLPEAIENVCRIIKMVLPDLIASGSLNF